MAPQSRPGPPFEVQKSSDAVSPTAGAAPSGGPIPDEVELLRQQVHDLRKVRGSLEETLAQRTVELGRVSEALRDEISRRRWAEKNLGNSEARYQSIFEHAVEGIYQSTPEGRFIRVNPALARMYGYETPEELMAAVHDVSEYVYVSAEDLAAFRRQIGDHGVVRNMEYRVRRRDGEVIWIRENARGVFGTDGRLLHYEGMIQDVSAEHRAREERKHLEAQLNQSQKMEAVGRLAGGIAHDFNNILGVITGYTGMILEDVPADSRTHGDAEEIMSAAYRAKELVQQILTFSRRQTVAPKPLQPGPVFAEAASMLGATLPATIDVREECAVGESAWVVADAVQFQQVVLNLGLNAAHAMQSAPERRLTLRLDTAGNPPAAWLATGPVTSRGWVRLSVADTGCGMAPEILERIFDPYFTTKGVGEGTGLGLSVVHGIVKTLDGEIVVRSRLGQGSEFEIFLPICAPGAPEIEADAATPVSGGGRVLLLDDEPALLRVTSLRLERAGFQVQAHHDPAQALEQFSADPSAFDAVLTDQTMPVMTGIDFARKVRGLRPGIPVILCSGNHGVVDSPEWHGVADVMLAKPVEDDELLRVLQKVLAR